MIKKFTWFSICGKRNLQYDLIIFFTKYHTLFIKFIIILVICELNGL